MYHQLLVVLGGLVHHCWVVLKLIKYSVDRKGHSGPKNGKYVHQINHLGWPWASTIHTLVWSYAYSVYCVSIHHASISTCSQCSNVSARNDDGYMNMRDDQLCKGKSKSSWINKPVCLQTHVHGGRIMGKYFSCMTDAHRQHKVAEIHLLDSCLECANWVWYAW